MKISSIIGFRPLIRGFFFYDMTSHSWYMRTRQTGFRPLIRGFFFYYYRPRRLLYRLPRFPSPYSGILFLWGTLTRSMYDSAFPSPYSGILFLSCHHDPLPDLDIFDIFRRSYPFLGQRGFPLTQYVHFFPYPSVSARINFFSPILYRFQFLLINILSHRLLLYHLCPTILLLYGHREYKYAMNLAPHL